MAIIFFHHIDEYKKDSDKKYICSFYELIFDILKRLRLSLPKKEKINTMNICIDRQKKYTSVTNPSLKVIKNLYIFFPSQIRPLKIIKNLYIFSS